MSIEVDIFSDDSKVSDEDKPGEVNQEKSSSDEPEKEESEQDKNDSNSDDQKSEKIEDKAEKSGVESDEFEKLSKEQLIEQLKQQKQVISKKEEARRQAQSEKDIAAEQVRKNLRDLQNLGIKFDKMGNIVPEKKSDGSDDSDDYDTEVKSTVREEIRKSQYETAEKRLVNSLIEAYPDLNNTDSELYKAVQTTMREYGWTKYSDIPGAIEIVKSRTISEKLPEIKDKLVEKARLEEQEKDTLITPTGNKSSGGDEFDPTEFLSPEAIAYYKRKGYDQKTIIKHAKTVAQAAKNGGGFTI